MKKALFALSLLVVAPMVKAGDATKVLASEKDLASTATLTSNSIGSTEASDSDKKAPAPKNSGATSTAASTSLVLEEEVPNKKDSDSTAPASENSGANSSAAPTAPASENSGANSSAAPTAPAITSNLFARGFTFVKDGAVYTVVSVKDSIVIAYDKVTGTIESFTPQMILSLRDSVRGAIANYPLTTVVLTAFVTGKTVEYLLDVSDNLEDEEDTF